MKNVNFMLMRAVGYAMDEIEDNSKFFSINHSAIVDGNNLYVVLVIGAVINKNDAEYWDSEGKNIIRRLCDIMYIKDATTTKVNIATGDTVVIQMKTKA